VKQLLAAVLAAAALAGCGSAQRGTASVWVTRDRGAHVLLVRKVPAGLTAMQGLERAAHVQTRYEGRFVQSIDGISGSLTRQQDWFYFVNGYEADRGAAEYRLHPGDIEWWDYRSWKGAMRAPIVVGAFPEPFLHGWNGHTRHTVVVASPVFAASARAVAARVHGDVLIAAGVSLRQGDNAIFLARGAPSIRVIGGTRPGSAVTFIVRARDDPLAVLRGARFRYSLP
jgi:Domain of unknown function (DUF4430)